MEMTTPARTALAIALAILFLLLGWIGGPLNSVDVGIVQWFSGVRHAVPALSAVAVAATQAGGAPGVILVSVAASAYLWFRARPRAATLLLAATLIERGTVEAIKLGYQRARPAIDPHPVATYSASFPSGHAANSMTAFVLIALLAVPPQRRSLALAIAIPLAALVGLTRPFLGVHWPSDMVAGWCIAGITIIAALRVAELPSIAAEQQHQIVRRHRAALD